MRRKREEGAAAEYPVSSLRDGHARDPGLSPNVTVVPVITVGATVPRLSRASIGPRAARSPVRGVSGRVRGREESTFASGRVDAARSGADRRIEAGFPKIGRTALSAWRPHIGDELDSILPAHLIIGDCQQWVALFLPVPTVV